MDAKKSVVKKQIRGYNVIKYRKRLLSFDISRQTGKTIALGRGGFV